MQSNWLDLPTFDGTTIQKGDEERLGKQYKSVFDLMKDGIERTPEEMEEATGYRWSSINARLRDMRKPKFGSHTVLRESYGHGIFGYRLLVHLG